MSGRLYACIGVGAPLFLLSTLLPRGGLLSDEPFVDIRYFRAVAARIADGELPYRDFFFEYPPGAIAPVALPELAGLDYELAFKLLMTLCGMIALAAGALLLVRTGASSRRIALAVGAIALSPLALGPVALNGYDLLPAAMVVAALAALAHGLPLAALAVLGAATATKFFPAVVAVPALIAIYRTWGLAKAMRGLAAFVVGGAVLTIPFLLIAPGGLGFSIWVHLRRGLQQESLAASFLLVLDRIGAYRVELRPASPGSVDVVGPVGEALAAIASVLALASVVAVALLARRLPRGSGGTALAAAAAVTGFVAFGKVFSPQYVVWLAPLVVLVPGAPGIAASALLLGAASVTQLWVLGYVRPFDVETDAWVALARNGLVVAVFAVLVTALMRAGRGASEAPGDARPP